MTRAFAAVAFIATTLAFSLRAADQTSQPIAKELSEAKTVYLMKSGADLRFVERFEREIKAWKRFALTDDLKAADIVMTLSEEALDAKGGAPAPIHIILTITGRVADPPLWRDSERSGVTTAAAANLAKRLRDRLEKAKESHVIHAPY